MAQTKAEQNMRRRVRRNLKGKDAERAAVYIATLSPEEQTFAWHVLHTGENGSERMCDTFAHAASAGLIEGHHPPL